VSAPRGLRARLAGLAGGFRIAYLPILITYFAYGASGVTGIALLYFQKDMLRLAPADVAAIGFWLGLPWSMKMVVGVASDAHPILGSRRRAYLLAGAACSVTGYGLLATVVDSRGLYLLAAVIVVVGYMVQDVVADALSVEVARTDEEIAHVQTLGRMALLVGTISVGYLSGVLAARLGPRLVFALAGLLPLLVAASALLVRETRRAPAPAATAAAGLADPAGTEEDPLGGGRGRLVMAVGLSYAALGVALEWFDAPYAQEIVLGVSGVLIVLLLNRVGLSRAVAVAAFVIFLFRATPGVGQGYSYWAIDALGFDQRFLGLLAQVGSIVSLLGLIAFRKPIARKPVSVTLGWVIVAGTVLSVPNIGLFYGLHDWLGISARTLAFIDTTISAPLGQLTMVPLLVLCAKAAPRGAEATMFAIMASLMNLALSASELGTRYLNTAFAVTQQDYSNLGRLMITVTLIGLVPLLALPLLRRHERPPAAARTPEPQEAL
jgi:hypothetical protein